MNSNLSAIITINKNQRGSVSIIVAVSTLVLIGFAAMAVDIGKLYVVRNELQNAAEAGSLAGATVLYNNSGTQVNVGANQIAIDAAVANKGQGSAVEVSAGEVLRGHWSFATQTFTPNDSTLAVDLWNTTSQALDLNVDFINAVKISTRRNATPVRSFFARVFGVDNFTLNADAVAYIGFAGTLSPWDVDQPIAICEQSILEDGEYDCNIGRFINSGQNELTNETGGWTSFSQPCAGGTNAQEVRSLVCGSGNPDPISLGGGMDTNGGDIQSALPI